MAIIEEVREFIVLDEYELRNKGSKQLAGQ